MEKGEPVSEIRGKIIDHVIFKIENQGILKPEDQPGVLAKYSRGLDVVEQLLEDEREDLFDLTRIREHEARLSALLQEGPDQEPFTFLTEHYPSNPLLMEQLRQEIDLHRTISRSKPESFHRENIE